jgi:hypothetical protein
MQFGSTGTPQRARAANIRADDPREPFFKGENQFLFRKRFFGDRD